MAMHPDLVEAIEAIFVKETDQTDELKTRLRKLIENAVTSGRVRDSDLREVLHLVTIKSEAGL